jgi:DNA-binding beta-propeller fold protein YncE
MFASAWSKTGMASVVSLLLPFLLSVAGCSNVNSADGSRNLVLEREIPLDHVSGRIDHLAIDLERHHLAVAELGNNTVDVIDLDSGRVLHRIRGLNEPQGVVFAASADLFAIANGGDGSVRLFKGSDFSPAGEVRLGDDADNVRLDKSAGHIIVGYGDGLAVLDLQTHTKLADIRLPDHPEGFAISGDGSRAFVNVPDARQIATVDLAAKKQVDKWKMNGLKANFPMAIDKAGRKLAVAFRDPARLVLIDPQSGATIADAATCGDSDDVFFDDRRGRIYVSCGAGFVDVFETADGKLRQISEVKTVSGARTSLFVPELDRLFVASRSSLLGNDAKILVLRPSW